MKSANKKWLKLSTRIYWISSRAFLLQESRGLVEQISEADMFSMSSMLLSLSFMKILRILSFRTDLILSWWIEAISINRDVSSYWVTYHKIVHLIPVRHIFTGMLAQRMCNFNVMKMNFLFENMSMFSLSMHNLHTCNSFSRCSAFKIEFNFSVFNQSGMVTVHLLRFFKLRASQSGTGLRLWASKDEICY
jgi:hypothetical protein